MGIRSSLFTQTSFQSSVIRVGTLASRKSSWFFFSCSCHFIYIDVTKFCFFFFFERKGNFFGPWWFEQKEYFKKKLFYGCFIPTKGFVKSKQLWLIHDGWHVQRKVMKCHILQSVLDLWLLYLGEGIVTIILDSFKGNIHTLATCTENDK